MADGALLAVAGYQVEVNPGSDVSRPASWRHVCLSSLYCPLYVALSIRSSVLMSLRFDSPGFLLTSLSCLALLVSKRVSQFGDELAAVEADGSHSHPAALDANVAGLDVPFADPGLGLALGAFGAEVVGLKLHLRPTINAVGFSGIDVFFGKQMGVYVKALR